MFGERVFQRPRIHVLTARHDHVVLTANDVKPARIVEIAHIAGTGHLVDDGLGATADVALGCQLTAHEDTAGHARSDWPAGLVEDANWAARDGSAHRIRGMA